MKYIFAYDGGGTKTRINVIDLEGNIVFDKITTGCNVFSIGEEAFTKVIQGLYVDAKAALNITENDINQVYLGLSGADLKSDYERLYNACKPIFNEVKHTILNDAWIILRSGLKEAYGAVCICGTGTNSACINKKQEKAILRALSYTLGTYGGGLDIARSALHYAFRAEELTYKYTKLLDEIPKLLQVQSMEEIIPLFYPKTIIDKKLWGEITGVVESCALEGDEVSIMILKEVAYHIALQTAGVIKQVKAENEEIPVVIGGRVFQIKVKEFIETFTETIRQEIPNAKIVVPKFTPVVGAYLFALDDLKIEQTKEIEQNLMNSGGRL